MDKESKILDIGTGMGAMSTLLALNGFNVLTGEPEIHTDIDHHENHNHHHTWNNWRDSAEKLGVANKIKFLNFDAQDLPFEDSSYDGIFLYDALEHIQNRALALNECLRVLKSEGVLVIIEWTKDQIEKEYKKYGYKIDFIDPQEFISQKGISMDIIKGKIINFYVLKKNYKLNV